VATAVQAKVNSAVSTNVTSVLRDIKSELLRQKTERDNAARASANASENARKQRLDDAMRAVLDKITRIEAAIAGRGAAVLSAPRADVWGGNALRRG
jgi:hypothetical protein